MNKIAVILYGPPGSGKGTQAKLLADKLGLFHFDTGDFLRKIIYNPKLSKNKEIQRERRLNEEGKLNVTIWVLKVVKKETGRLADLGESIVYSGSPRTLYEAFGDQNHEGLIKFLEKRFGKKNLKIFILQIPDKESIRRNSQRSSCSVCKTPLMAKYKNIKNCPFCGGKIKKRKDDRKEVIIIRLKEYRAETKPIFSELKKRGYKLFKINGAELPFQVHEAILKHFS